MNQAGRTFLVEWGCRCSVWSVIKGECVKGFTFWEAEQSREELARVSEDLIASGAGLALPVK